jgi:hypothetical protein
MHKHSAGITNSHYNVKWRYRRVGRSSEIKEKECCANTMNVNLVRRLERAQLTRQLELREIEIWKFERMSTCSVLRSSSLPNAGVCV